ncbi:hypothetical protein MFLAVUS_008825 [Mucor flavus]|uniref:Rab-GAP TBC domain-containing protein n=1 Tax=Mucor flavus TaxID=439312 RepID=A0ABP9Z8A4_9FUNG
MTEINEVITPVNETKKDNFILDKDTVITNGSAITVRSQSSSSLADKSGYDTDDAESSHDSFDTIATTNENEKETETNGVRRRRALTVTQNSRVEINTINHNDDHIQELQQSTSLIVGNQDYSDSDSFIDEDEGEGTHKRHESHRSTMSSIHSFVSSASNYDLLLARLGSKDASTTSLNIDHAKDTSHSFEKIFNNGTATTATVEQQQKDDDSDDLLEEEIDWEFWSKVISDFNGVAKSEPKILSHHIQRGIPPSLRGMVWQLLAKSKNLKLEDQYMQLLKDESVYEKAIARDLPRACFVNHDQEALFNVVKAYSLYDTDVGYNQSILHVTVPLLMNMPEEEAFCVLVQLMNKYNLRNHFVPQSELISQRLYQLEGLIADHLPHIQRHFEAHRIRSNTYAYQWFSTLFTFKIPTDIVFRIYDIILSEGLETLLRFSLALIQKNQATILSLEFDDLVHYLKNDLLEPYKDNANQLIKDAFQIQIVSKRLDRLAKDFQVESARANNEAEAIEALKRQNKSLADSIKQLDNNYSDLDKEHTQVASELITAKMDIARIHDENEALHQQSNDLKKALETLPTEVETRVKEEMEILYTKNAALVERNSALEDQLAYMENMIIEIKVKYAESESEREGLRQRLTDLKRLMG